MSVGRLRNGNALRLARGCQPPLRLERRDACSLQPRCHLLRIKPDEDEPEGELIARWQAELRDAGYPLPALVVVTLAPGADGALVSSERAVVDGVDAERERLVLRTQDERRVTLVGDEISAERLAHGYAVTAHRSQGQTTERAHVY